MADDLYKCPLCGEKKGERTFRLHLIFDKNQIEKIRRDHPSWTDREGSCFICANIYRREFGLPPLSKEDFYRLGLT